MMELGINALPAGPTQQAQALERGIHTLPPIYQGHGGDILPSAPAPSQIYPVLPPILSNIAHLDPRAQIYTAPTPEAVARAPSSSSPYFSVCVIAIAVVAAMVVAGVITAAVIVTTNNNNNNSNNNETDNNNGNGDEAIGATNVTTTENPCYFRCHRSPTSQCITLSEVCNGDWDCVAGEDEVGCHSTEVNCTEFSCTSGTSEGSRCISSSLVCDGHNDCLAGEDEYECASTPLPDTTCSTSQFTCTDGSCVPAHWECDHIIDCMDETDEANCPCDNNQYRCHNGSTSGNCIPINKLCNGVEDCNNGADEVDCESCTSGAVYCNGICIPEFKVCVEYPDCNSSNDEIDCTTSCPSDQLFCASGSIYSYYSYCIPLWMQCNNHDDCRKGEDEDGCDNITCSATQFTCSSGGEHGPCIPGSWVCNSIVDCTGATDEANCTCNANDYECQNGSVNGSCISNHKVCDGIKDCNDGADEGDCENIFKCLDLTSASPITISKQKVCDGVEDCLAGSDENKCLIAPNGADGGIVHIYNVADNAYYRFCSDNWVENTGKEACAAMGYSIVSDTRDVIGNIPVQGIRVDTAGSFNLSVLSHRAPVYCPLNTTVELKCARNESCGLTSRTQTRVVGGENTVVEQHPWQVSLQYGDWTSTGWSHFCGGSIITSGFVLTAAHCVHTIHPILYPSCRVVTGVTSLNEAVSGITNAYNIKTIVSHQLFDLNSIQWDVALIQVDRNFILSSTTQYVCVPAPGELFPDASNVSATGWGRTTEGGDIPVILQAASVQLYNTKSCQSRFPVFAHLVTDDMICAGKSDGGIGVCQGDSGGPLLSVRNSRKYLIGATSWGWKGLCARPGLPALFAEVSDIVDWLNREMRKLQST